MNATVTPALTRSHVRENQMPSGRSVIVKITGNEEVMEIRSPAGDVEMCITLTDTGPVVKLHSARLELASPDSVNVKCRHFNVEASEDTILKSGGDVRVQGKVIHLN